MKRFYRERNSNFLKLKTSSILLSRSFSLKRKILINSKYILLLCLSFFLIALTAIPSIGQCANQGTADNQDFDCDGVINSADADDDNDGILDSDECSLTTSQQAPFSISNGSTGSYSLTTGNGFILDITSLDNSFALSVNGTSISALELNFENGAAVGPPNIRFQDGDQYGVNTPAIWNFGNSTTPIVRLILEENGSITFLGSKTANGPLFPLELYNGNSFNSVNWNVNGTNNFVLSQFVQGPTNMAGSFFTATNATCDTDLDNIPDIFDNDSDNDGCPDAIEGGSNFTIADIQNDTLTGGVDANGVPIIVTSSGQAIGSSQDSTTQDVNCPTMTANNDNFTNQAPGGTTPTVFTNDDANGTPATDALVTTPTIISNGGLTGITFNADGTANIPANATSGTYTVIYEVCLENAPTVCNQADLVITVATMTANNDNFTNQAPGGTTPTVFTNDDANGTPATDALVTTPTIISNGGLTGITFNTDGTANIPANATSGTYTITYEVCLENAPTVCNQADMIITLICTTIAPEIINQD